MKKTAVLLLVAAFTGICAEDETVNRVFQLKYASANRVANVLRPYGAVNPDDQLKTITVQGRKSLMPEIEQIIQRFDVPPPPVQNIDVTIYLMSALGQPSAGSVPPELEPVVKQLKGIFSYKGYQLIDTQVIRVREGHGGEASGVVDSAGKSDMKTISQIKFRAASVSADEKGRAIRIDRLQVGLKIPVTSLDSSGAKQYQYLDTGISTDVDIREGQKVVVGKANMDGSDRASIVVLTAKVVE
jgi:hypothetical protein